MAQSSPSFSARWNPSVEATNTLRQRFSRSCSNTTDQLSSVFLDLDMDRLAWQQLERVNSLPGEYPGSRHEYQQVELDNFQSVVDDYIDGPPSSDLLDVTNFSQVPITVGRSPHSRPEVVVPPESSLPGVSPHHSPEQLAPRKSNRTGRRRRPDNASLDGWVASKNLISERKRREKLQKGLITLREMVPMINMKMDKVSILTDAVNYVQDLKRQLGELEGDCMNDEYGSMFDVKHHVKLVKTSSVSDSFGTSEAGENQKNLSGDAGSFCSELFQDDSVVQGLCDNYNETSPSSTRDWDLHLSQLDVIKLEHGVYKLDLVCMEQSGILVQLSQAIEAFVIEIVHTSIVFITSAKITCSFVVKMSSWNDMTLEDVAADFKTILGKSGLQFQE